MNIVIQLVLQDWTLSALFFWYVQHLNDFALSSVVSIHRPLSAFRWRHLASLEYGLDHGLYRRVSEHITGQPAF